MKKLLSLVILMSVCSMLAQAPQKMSYQAIIRNAADGLVVSSNVGMKVSILKGSISGTPVYVETHTGTTNVNGLLSIEIGTGNASSGSFSTINWGNDSYFVKTETDPDGGSNYTITGTSQLLSVPYALYAENTKSKGKNTIILKGDITDAGAAALIARDLGPDTQFIYITQTTALTTVNLSSATNLVKLTVTGNTALTTLNANGLEEILDEADIGSNPALTTLSLSNLKNIDDFNIASNNMLSVLNLNNLQKTTGNGLRISDNHLTSVTLPELISGPVSFNSGNGSTDPYLISIIMPQYISGSFVCYNNLITSLNLPNFTNGTLVVRGSALTSLTLPALTNGSYVDISANLNLTSINFPALTSGTSININSNQSLISISFPNITAVETINCISLPSLTSINFPTAALSNTDIRISYCGLTSYSLPFTVVRSIEMTNNSQLATVNAPNLISGMIKINSNQIVNTISFPNLTSGSFEASSDTALANIDLTNFNVGFIGITGSNAIQQLSFPNLVNGSFVIINNHALASISFPNLTTIGSIFQLNNNHLPSAQVNYVLNRLLSIAPASGKNVTLRLQSPLAPPTGQGIIDKATLLSSGNTILTD